MEYREILTWIIDKKGYKNVEDQYQFSVDFVHSLNQKCDRVGWSKLDLLSKDAPTVLKAIKDLCADKNNRCSARGYYERRYIVKEPKWYALKAYEFTDSEKDSSGDETFDVFNGPLHPEIRAYAIYDGKPRCNYRYVFVPGKIREFCLKNGHDDVRFCWLRDIGRYEGQQYFAILPRKRVDHCLRVLADSRMPGGSRKRLESLGGSLPSLLDIFPRIMALSVHCPDCYLKSELPESGFAYANWRTLRSFNDTVILMSADIVRKMISEGVITEKWVEPVLVLDEIPAGYDFAKTREADFPDDAICAQRLEEHDQLISRKRPAPRFTDRRALEILKDRKETVPEVFEKRMAPAARARLRESGAPQAKLEAYYGFANGFQVDEEYYLFSFQQSVKETEEFLKDLNREELYGGERDVTVIGTCANGDTVLMDGTGRIFRWDHEIGDVCEQWNSPAAFFCTVTQ